MSRNALARWDASPHLRVMDGGRASVSATSSWWERRARLREVVGGCPDHWWSPAARRTAACTCDRFD
jgi:hypothetical protein